MQEVAGATALAGRYKHRLRHGLRKTQRGGQSSTPRSTHPYFRTPVRAHRSRATERDRFHSLPDQSVGGAAKLQRVFPHVFATPGSLKSKEQLALAACLWAGEGSAASHRCAASLMSLEGFEGNYTTEITTSRSLKAKAVSIIIHRRSSLPQAEIRRRKGIPLTTPERTLMDLAAIVERDRLEIALEDALRRGLTSNDRLHNLIQRHRSTRSAGIAPLRALLELRAHAPPTESWLETRFIQFMRKHRLPSPVRQYRLSNGSEFVARFDFAYPGERLGIETDGFKHHSGRRDWARDRRRLSAIAACGWRVLHVTTEDLRKRPEETAFEIRKALGIQTFALEIAKNAT